MKECKNLTFSIVLVLVAVLMVRQVLPPTVEENFDVKALKNQSNIISVFQGRQIKYFKDYKVDVIDIKKRGKFEHSKLGYLGYKDNFFADIQGEFRIKNDVSLQLIVESDDGFVLQVDGEQLCQHEHPRALLPTYCLKSFSQGVHQFTLSYFQGFGGAGLRMYYREVDKRRKYLEA